MTDMSVADVAAVMGGSRNHDNGWGGDNGALLMLLIIALLGGFGNNRGFGGGGGYGGGVGGNELYPWLNNADNVNGGFRDQMLQNGIQGIGQSVQSLATQLCGCCGDIQMALCNGFSGVNTNMSNGFAGLNLGIAQGFAGVEAGANARQMADMQQQFAAQMATMQGFNGLQGQLAECCCENRLATANQTATILAENCADRAAISDGVRDIIAGALANTQRQIDNQNMWGQRISDQLTRYRMEDKDEKIADLRQQVYMKDLAASQLAQDSRIINGVYNRFSECPVGTMPVYGMQPIFTCQNNGCGCGMAA